jgi:hypothetical protein
LELREIVISLTVTVCVAVAPVASVAVIVCVPGPTVKLTKSPVRVRELELIDHVIGSTPVILKASILPVGKEHEFSDTCTEILKLCEIP